MGRVVLLEEPRSVRIGEYADAVPDGEDVRIATRYTGISAGTELTQYRGENPYLARQWDGERRLFLEGTPSVDYPVDDWGYQEVGVVEAVGDAVHAVEIGQAVWGAWGHRRSVIVGQHEAAAHLVPSSVTLPEAVFARMGAIALNAVLDADVHLGETVAVLGSASPGSSPRSSRPRAARA